MYLQPAKRNSHEEGKLVALFYTVVTPMLNPLIYTLRNKTVKKALRHIVLENCGFGGIYILKLITCEEEADLKGSKLIWSTRIFGISFLYTIS